MSILDSNAIFHRGDSQELLNYLNLRLKAGDLSNEEALAILSAVHAELGNGSLTDPRDYRLYNYTLKSLQQVMPDIYDFIVATWNRRIGKNLNSPDDKDSNVDGEVLMENKSQINVVDQKEGLNGIHTLMEQLEKTDDEEGPEELEEKETAAVEGKNGELEQEETEEDSEENSVKIEEDHHEENQEAEDDIIFESLQEIDTDELGKEELENENTNVDNDIETNRDNDNETNEEYINGEVGNESPEGTEKLETGGEVGEAKGEGMEWPEIEQPLPEEPIGGPEGIETSSESED